MMKPSRAFQSYQNPKNMFFKLMCLLVFTCFYELSNFNSLTFLYIVSRLGVLGCDAVQ